jgi:hypothetical protein
MIQTVIHLDIGILKQSCDERISHYPWPVAGDKGNHNLETILGACETDNIAQTFKLLLDV